MKKILNNMFFVMKFFLLIVAFGLSLYIVFSMYSRVEKSIVSSIGIFLPYLLLLVIFSINITLKQKIINSNLFYNLTCCLVFGCVCLVSIRSILDENMVLNKIMGYNINFAYFSDFIVFMKIMMYGLFVSNIIFLITNKFKNPKKDSNIAHKVEVL